MIWFRLHKEKGRSIRLCLPISLHVLLELLDSLLDVITLICMFAPKKPRFYSGMSVHTAKELTEMLMALLGSITEDGPYDLVDVAADHAKVSIHIR